MHYYYKECDKLIGMCVVVVLYDISNKLFSVLHMVPSTLTEMVWNTAICTYSLNIY